MNLPETNSPAHETASWWAAKLDGADLSAAERRELSHWLDASPIHRQLLAEYCQLSADLEQQLSQATASESLVVRDLKTVRPPRWGRRAWIASMAAAAVIAMVAVTRRDGSETARYASNVGQRQQRTLADGSSLELNSQTAVVVQFTGNERRVRLASGQAYFKVVRDVERPFIVETPLGAVRVTGTAFDVRADLAAPLEVTVAEGTVQVSVHDSDGARRAPIAVTAGHRYVGTAEAGSVTPLSSTALADTLAWRHGQVVFDGTPLREAVARFARYHGRSIVVGSRAGELPVGGRYSLDDFDGFVAALEEVFPVAVSRTLDGTVQVQLRPQG